jgi:ElaB/YqjD/DUF883 family membrane-anchored ribosome-binding protein
LRAIKFPPSGGANVQVYEAKRRRTDMAATFDVARERLVSDVKAVLTDTEEIMQAATGESKEKVAAIKPRIEANLQRAKARLREIEQGVEMRARESVKQVDVYAHEHPWQTAGIAAATGAAVGAIVALLFARR